MNKARVNLNFNGCEYSDRNESLVDLPDVNTKIHSLAYFSRSQHEALQFITSCPHMFSKMKFIYLKTILGLS